MKQAKGDFGQGSVSSTIIRLSLPIMAAELVHVLYNLVDRMFLGHMEETGTAAITGIGVVFPLITLINAFAALCGMGGSPLAAIARGEGDNERAQRIMETAFTMLVAIGAALTVILFIFAPPLLSLLGGDENSLPYAVSYFRIYVIGTIPVMISLGMNRFINAQGFAQIGMMTVIIGAVLNLILDPILIYALDMGVEGAALATVISQTVSAAWVIFFLRGSKPINRLERFCFDVGYFKKILKLGVTGFTFRMTNSITQALINVTLKAWGGVDSTLYVGAMSVIHSLREVAMLPASGFVSGAEPVMSYNYGAKKYDRVADTIRFTFFAALIVNLIGWCLFMFLPKPLTRIFTDDEALIDTTMRCMRVFFLAYPFMTLQNIGQHTFVSLNYPKHAFFFSLLRKIGLIVPFTLLLPGWGLGVMGPFWAEVISELVGATATFTAMYFIVWKKMRRLMAEQKAE